MKSPAFMARRVAVLVVVVGVGVGIALLGRKPPEAPTAPHMTPILFGRTITPPDPADQPPVSGATATLAKEASVVARFGNHSTPLPLEPSSALRTLINGELAKQLAYEGEDFHGQRCPWDLLRRTGAVPGRIYGGPRLHPPAHQPLEPPLDLDPLRRNRGRCGAAGVRGGAVSKHRRTAHRGLSRSEF